MNSQAEAAENEYLRVVSIRHLLDDGADPDSLVVLMTENAGLTEDHAKRVVMEATALVLPPRENVTPANVHLHYPELNIEKQIDRLFKNAQTGPTFADAPRQKPRWMDKASRVVPSLLFVAIMSYLLFVVWRVQDMPAWEVVKKMLGFDWP